MDILISNEQGTVAIDEQFLRKVANDVLHQEQVAGNIELSIALVDESKIRTLNATYRGIDASTDVLSFEVDTDTAEPDAVKEIGSPETGIPSMIGDVIICPLVAERQAKEYGQTFEQEMALLLTHGILHLLGYDHIEDSDAEAMELREREILSSIFSSRVANGRSTLCEDIDG